jgi:hypothetical protein
MSSRAISSFVNRRSKPGLLDARLGEKGELSTWPPLTEKTVQDRWPTRDGKLPACPLPRNSGFFDYS